MDAVTSTYLSALHDAIERPIRGDPHAALQRFLTLNAAYFLGEWLPSDTHVRLVERLVAGLDGLADLTPPPQETPATQLAQHARELAAEFGPTLWTDRIAAETEALVPQRESDWDAAATGAISAVAAGSDGRSLLLVHARRRLWELTRAVPVDQPSVPAPEWALRFARDAVAAEDGHAIQVAEALLAELSRRLPIVRASPGAGHGHTTCTAST